MVTAKWLQKINIKMVTKHYTKNYDVKMYSLC
jgi:hypothetical protein